MSGIILDGKATTVDISKPDLARFKEARLTHEFNMI